MIGRLTRWIDATAAFARQPAAEIMTPYHRTPAPVAKLVHRTFLMTACIFLGLFYGFFFTVLPPALIVYLLIPFVLLILVVIWALPDQRHAPVRLLEGLFWAFLLILVLWPVYLAFSFPGLPWISFRRLVSFPMGLVLLICISTSKAFRDELGQVVRSLPALWKMVVAFTAVQFFSIFFSARPFASLNLFINNVFSSTAVFFIAAWALSRPRRMDNFVYVVMGMAISLCVMGMLENYNQQILWAQHIPFFFKIEDEAVSMMLMSNFRDGAYRVTTTYSVSLALAEFLALMTPFVLQQIERTPGIGKKLLLIALDLLLLTVIILTRARLGIVGFIVTHAFYGCLWAFKRWRTNKSDLLAPAIAFAYPVLVGLFAFGMFFVDAIKFRTIGGGSTGFSDDAREVQWTLAKPLVLHNPFGYGIGQGAEKLGFTTPGGQLTVDSYVVSLLMDFGLPGCFIFFGMILFASERMTRLWFTRTDRAVDLALPLAAALAAFAVIKTVFAQDDNHPLVFIMLGMAAALQARATLADAAKPTPGRR